MLYVESKYYLDFLLFIFQGTYLESNSNNIQTNLTKNVFNQFGIEVSDTESNKYVLIQKY